MLGRLGGSKAEKKKKKQGKWILPMYICIYWVGLSYINDGMILSIQETFFPYISPSIPKRRRKKTFFFFFSMAKARVYKHEKDISVPCLIHGRGCAVLLDMTGVKRAASEAIAGVDSIIVAAKILFTVGGVRFIPRLRVERTGSSFPWRAIL